MSVKAKFKCVSTTDFGHAKRVDFMAVQGAKGEDADFTKYTPSGQLSMNMDPDAPAVEYFKVNKDYYLTFDTAE